MKRVGLILLCCVLVLCSCRHEQAREPGPLCVVGSNLYYGLYELWVEGTPVSRHQVSGVEYFMPGDPITVLLETLSDGGRVVVDSYCWDGRYLTTVYGTDKGVLDVK